MSVYRRLIEDCRLLRTLPQVRISLMRSAAEGNDPFFVRMVDRFYREATRRHARFPLIRNLRYGVALSEMPGSAEEYLAQVESSARRNVKKALRNGYTFSRIDHDDWLAGIAEIHRSSEVRQGPMPGELLRGTIRPLNDPPSRDDRHDYLYFGVVRDGELCAYAGCMVAGELLAIGNLYGHHARQPDGVVPLLLVQIVDYCRKHHPRVRYYMYDKYFGAGETLRRFKRKFGFEPHKVDWELG